MTIANGTKIAGRMPYMILRFDLLPVSLCSQPVSNHCAVPNGPRLARTVAFLVRHAQGGVFSMGVPHLVGKRGRLQGAHVEPLIRALGWLRPSKGRNALFTRLFRAFGDFRNDYTNPNHYFADASLRNARDRVNRHVSLLRAD